MKHAFFAAMAATWLVWASPAWAHHSFAMYDTTKVVVLKGTVKEFDWTNPHALLWLVGSATDGEPDLWTIELPTSPGNLTRMGWTKHSLHAGDVVSVEINPLRDGKHGGSFKKVTFASGQVLVATAKDDNLYGDASAGAAAPGVDAPDGSPGAVLSGDGGGGDTAGGTSKSGCSVSDVRQVGGWSRSWSILVLSLFCAAVRRRRPVARAPR
jgi:hypothetical protein